jgi:site-specific recombinase XerD
MDQARTRFSAYLSRRYPKSSTPKHYLSDLDIFIQTVADKSPEDIGVRDIDRFIDSQLAAGLKPATINRRLASLHTFFEFLAFEDPEREWPNPVVKRRHRLRTGRRLPRDLPDADVARLFSAMTDPRDRAMFGLMVGAGLRVGEVACLRLDGIQAPTAADQLCALRVRGKGDRERVVWLTRSLQAVLREWLDERRADEHDYVFHNQHSRPISVSGIQYRLKQYGQTTGVALSCHHLRHTFARRLVEGGLPVDSLARLLGHSRLRSTQRYIDGADPTVRADFLAAMAGLEKTLLVDRVGGPVDVPPREPSSRQPAPQEQLARLRQRLAGLPAWWREPLDAYLRWRWSTWRAQTAYALGGNLIGLFRRFWGWAEEQRAVDGWEKLRRADLQAWVRFRIEAGAKPDAIRNQLGQIRSFVRFAQEQECPVDPGLFLVQAPRSNAKPLPRHLSEADYRRLERHIFQATESDSYDAAFDRACFLTLAHTGVRISELLDLRVGDLSLAAGRAIVRGSKPGHDRAIYLTPALIDALRRFLPHRPDLPGEDHVFLLHRRVPSVWTIRNRLTRYAEEVNLHVTPHRLRHTLATRLVNRGMSIQSLRKLLGHRSIDTTMLYARLYDETVHAQFREATAEFESIAVEEQPQPDGLAATQEGLTPTLAASTRLMPIPEVG